MLPSGLKLGFVLLGVKIFGAAAAGELMQRGRKGAEKIAGEHVHDVGEDSLGELAATGVDVVNKLEQGLSFHLLFADVLGRVAEVKAEGAQVEFLDEDILLFGGANVAESRRRFMERLLKGVRANGVVRFRVSVVRWSNALATGGGGAGGEGTVKGGLPPAVIRLRLA
jgi:hypothetical protein